MVQKDLILLKSQSMKLFWFEGNWDNEKCPLFKNHMERMKDETYTELLASYNAAVDEHRKQKQNLEEENLEKQTENRKEEREPKQQVKVKDNRNSENEPNVGVVTVK